MTLQSSGQISANNINVELGKSGTAQFSLNDADGRSLVGKPSSGSQISYSDFYGKSLVFNVPLVISANTTNYSLSTAVSSYTSTHGWNGTSKLAITLTINSGVYVYSTSTGSYALTLSGSYPSGSTIVVTNNGYIIGKGGNGGSQYWFYYSAHPATNGGNGGPAVFANVPLTFYNYGSIAGGGGGGGGAGSVTYEYYNPALGKQYASYSGGQGGGGASYGAGGSVTTPFFSETAPSGGLTTGGAGSNFGGAGGNMGSAGADGQTWVQPPQGDLYGYDPDGLGGAAGNAVVGIAYITVGNTGTVLGGVV